MNTTLQTGMIILGVTASTLFGSDADRRFIITVVAIVALVVYRIFRKWPNKIAQGKMDFISINLVELILAFVIAPGAVRAILDTANTIIKLL